MAKLLVALLFAVLMLGLGTGSSTSYACDDKAAQATQAGDVTGVIKVADDDDDGDDDDDDDDDGENEG